MNADPISVLLIEDNAGDARLVAEFLADSLDARFEVTVVESLDGAQLALDGPSCDVVLLDLTLPDAAGLDLVTRIVALRPDLPLLVLTGRQDEELALEALRQGAQDYLRKADMDERLLGRAIRYAIERHEGELELQQAKEAAETAYRAKSQFLANVSHELRTPLNAITSISDLLTRKEISSDHRPYIDAMKTSADSLLEMVDDILDLSRIKAGGLTLERTSFRLRERLDSALKGFRMQANEKGLEFSYSVAEDVPDHLVGDPARLRQIVGNLVSNAIKFTTTGKIDVAVDLQRQEESAIHLHATVRDTGIGIPAEAHVHIVALHAQ